MRLLVAIPALDEESTIADVVSGVPRSIPGISRVDLLVVDDGSTDATAGRAEAAGAPVVSHGRNRGLGEAFRTALRHARRGGYHVLVTIDADGQFDPAGIPDLVAPITADEADLVTASRFADPSMVPEMPAMKLWGNRRVASLVSRLAGVRVHDATCGFRALGPRALERLSSFSRFTYTQEVIIDLAGKGLRLREVPLRVLGERPVGSSRIAGNLWRYALLSLAAMYSTAHDHRPWRFYGLPGTILLAIGVAADAFVLVRWLVTGAVRPFAGIAVGGLFLITFAALLFLFASLADTASHNRSLLEDAVADRTRRHRAEADGAGEEARGGDA